MPFRRPSRRTLGFLFMGLSFLLWGVALATPFVDADLSTRAGIGLGFYGLSYMAFGLGGKMLGDSLWPMIKRRIWPDSEEKVET